MKEPEEIQTPEDVRASAIRWIAGGIGLSLAYTGSPLLPFKIGALIRVVAMLGVWVCWVEGCFLIAKGKGHPDRWGWFGLFWVVGLVVVLLLPDRTREDT